MSEALVAPSTPTERLRRYEALSTELAQRNLDGFLVPRADEYQGEYVPARAQRLAWLTGFTGSAGLAVMRRAGGSAIFVDGRYTLQVQDEIDPALFTPQHSGEILPRDWLAAQLQAGERLGFDPWLHTPDEVQSYRHACAQAGAELVACATNPLDAVWHDQPEPPLAQVSAHPAEYAGEDATAKRSRIGQLVAARGAQAAVLTQPDSIAWLLNIRGGDVPHTPLPLSFAVLHADGHVALFMDRRKCTPDLNAHFGNGVTLYEPDRLGAELDALGQGGSKILLDPARSSAWISDRLSTAGATLITDADPCLLPKARKNAVELAGTRAAHCRDGAALSRFLHWLASHAPSGTVDELSAAEQLLAFRQETGLLRDTSFDTIAGAGPNGAIVHYRSSPRSNRRLEPGTLFLLDSGGQYPDGTTDVTRTIAIGTPSIEHKDRFTRVLKGHITLARCRFPAGTSGSQLDALARYALWQAGLDYDHGTGHGVGSYLSVHEGPQRISKVPNKTALEPGMIVSNEPGYYQTGAYGIRIENLVVVTPAEPVPGGERPMHGFETLTLAPIDLALVEPALLEAADIAWLNAYHAQVRALIGPQLTGAAADWLVQATRPL